MDLSLGQRLLQQTQQGSIQLLEDAEHEQSLTKFWGQAPLLLLQQRPDNSKVLSELQCPLQAEPDLMGEDVVKPGTQDGSQRLAEGGGLGLRWQSLQSLQHRLQYSADHQPSILTRNAGKFRTETMPPVPTPWHVEFKIL